MYCNFSIDSDIFRIQDVVLCCHGGENYFMFYNNEGAVAKLNRCYKLSAYGREIKQKFV